MQGQGLSGFNPSGTTAATVAGTLGALGAVCIIFAFRTGGTPTYVMPLVFGGAPLVNVLYTMYIHPPKAEPNPLLYIGFLVTAIGAATVLYFKPQVVRIRGSVLGARCLSPSPESTESRVDSSDYGSLVLPPNRVQVSLGAHEDLSFDTAGELSVYSFSGVLGQQLELRAGAEHVT